MCARLFRLGFEQLGAKIVFLTEKVYVNEYHTTPEWGVCDDLETSSIGGRIGFEMVV